MRRGSWPQVFCVPQAAQRNRINLKLSSIAVLCFKYKCTLSLRALTQQKSLYIYIYIFSALQGALTFPAYSNKSPASYVVSSPQWHKTQSPQLRARRVQLIKLWKKHTHMCYQYKAHMLFICNINVLK